MIDGPRQSRHPNAQGAHSDSFPRFAGLLESRNRLLLLAGLSRVVFIKLLQNSPFARQVGFSIDTTRRRPSDGYNSSATRPCLFCGDDLSGYTRCSVPPTYFRTLHSVCKIQKHIKRERQTSIIMISRERRVTSAASLMRVDKTYI